MVSRECALATRRDFCKSAITGVIGSGLATGRLTGLHAANTQAAPCPMQLGLVTYNWGKEWDLPTVIENCSTTGFAGVELRSTHKHGVEIDLDDSQRAEVAARFADSPVVLVGLGTACEYHSPDPDELEKNLQETREFVELCHDVGGEGIKVRPNGFPDGVPVEKTLEQIGQSLHQVGEFADGYGVTIRLEVHGKGTSELPHIKTIMDVADHRNVVVCWNCNPQDMAGNGLEHNFHLVADKIGTIHIHDLRADQYPWGKLFKLLKAANFEGWTLLEDGKPPQDIVQAMRENREIWNQLANE